MPSLVNLITLLITSPKKQLRKLVCFEQKVMIAIGIMVILIWDFVFFISSPISIKLQPKNQKESILLKRGENIFNLADKLQQSGLVDHQIYFILLGIITGDYKQLQAGEYQIKNYKNAKALIKSIVNGETIIHYFPIIAGEDFSKIVNQVKQTSLIYDEQTEKWLKNLVNSTNENNFNPYFIADSFAYQYQDNFSIVLQASNQKLKQTLKKLREEFSSDWTQSKSDHQMIIIASILEKESANHQDRRKIAGVIKNRLEKSMRLQIDASAIFAHQKQGDPITNLTYKDLKIQSPYNTYHKNDLPVSAISIVSESALKAAFNPIIHPFLFYVALGNDGIHQFSQTYEEHLKWVQSKKNQ